MYCKLLFTSAFDFIKNIHICSTTYQRSNRHKTIPYTVGVKVGVTLIGLNNITALLPEVVTEIGKFVMEIHSALLQWQQLVPSQHP